MTILVVGASGATGRLLVEHLLNRGEHVRVIVRSPEKLPNVLKRHENLTIIHASLLALDDAAIVQHTNGCVAVASCLGHNMSWKGIFGPPRRLVTEATHRLCCAIKTNAPTAPTPEPTKFVLMNTSGNSNRDLNEPLSFTHKCVIWLLRLLLPPQADNEQAADYLRTRIGQDDSAISWAAVRPDDLIDADQVTPYEIHPSPTRSAIFNAGKTSRINVGHFMADLITDENVWAQWKGQMPVIYNQE